MIGFIVNNKDTSALLILLGVLTNNGNFETNVMLIFQYFISIEHRKLIKIINIRGDLLGNSYCGYL